MAAILLVLRRQKRKFRERSCDLDSLTDLEVLSRYRLTKDAIRYVERVCREDLSPRTKRSFAIESMTKVFIFIFMFAHVPPVIS